MQKIMIVEDDSKIAEHLKIHIEKYGYDVTCVIDFEHVMNAFYDINPDLVLLDINLPSFDGYYWCRQIRKESTLYDDYAINERLFHWQTQSRVAEGSKIAERYIHHKKRNHQIALFVREYKKEYGYTSPFVFLGTADHVSHSGNKPMSFIWGLKEEMPSYLVPRANKNIL